MTCARAPVCSLLSLLLIHTTAAVTLNSADCSFSNRQSNRQSTRRAEPIALHIVLHIYRERSTAQHSTAPNRCALWQIAHICISLILSLIHTSGAAQRDAALVRIAALHSSALLSFDFDWCYCYTLDITLHSVHSILYTSRFEALRCSAAQPVPVPVPVPLPVCGSISDCSALLCCVAVAVAGGR